MPIDKDRILEILNACMVLRGSVDFGKETLAEMKLGEILRNCECNNIDIVVSLPEIEKGR